MILSFHPIFPANQNIICAGRKPDMNDLSAIKDADAVILPQGCSELLYNMAKSNCPHVFPNFDARFTYPGKIGQTKLFQKTNTAHPATELFPTVRTFQDSYGQTPDLSSFIFPCVFKFDWGGEGDMVYRVSSVTELDNLILKAGTFEKSGQSGFLVQENIITKGLSLRINIIGRRLISFWKIPDSDSEFYSNLSKGGKIAYDLYPELQETGKEAVSEFCRKTGINLAGFDLLFSFDESGKPDPVPLFLEINYFFGRRGLGGSEKFYEILVHEIDIWLSELGLSVKAS